MKKQWFSFGVLFTAVVLISCGNNSGDNNTANSDSGAGMDNSEKNLATDTASNATTGTVPSATAATAGTVAEADRTFMMDAASAGMMEVETSRLAEQNGSSARVKGFATMMIQDHTNANNELKGLASAKGVMLPDSMMAKHRAHVDMLKNKTGKELDKAYMSMMVNDHNEDVNKFQVASNNAADADLKAFAGKTLPTLRKHLDSSKAINTSMKK
jgi:putative membrane protein